MNDTQDPRRLQPSFNPYSSLELKKPFPTTLLLLLNKCLLCKTGCYKGSGRYNRARLFEECCLCFQSDLPLFPLWSVSGSQLWLQKRRDPCSTWIGLLRYTSVWASAGFSVWYFATRSSSIMLSFQCVISAGFLTARGDLCYLFFSLVELTKESESENVVSGQNWAN